MCSLPLKSVLKANALVLERTLEIKDRSSGSASGSTPRSEPEADWPVVGQLKVAIISSPCQKKIFCRH
jgi:hypothetical protein